MIIVMKPRASKEDIDKVMSRIKKEGLTPKPLYGTERTVIAVIGDSREISASRWTSMDSVEKVTKILKPYKLTSREFKSKDTVVNLDGLELGGKDFVIIAGPCSVENEEQIMEIAKKLSLMGIKVMRASAFKPRTSPYSFQGLGIKGLKLLKKAKEKTGLLVESEVMDVRDVKVAEDYLDVLRIGARNMQNFDLLKEVGKIDKPVILKRGMSAKIKEWIMAAEYILSRGNKKVIFCERGIRTFETTYRNTLDISAVPYLKNKTHLPVIVDPSHASGKRNLIVPLSKAAVAAGADGLLVEVHPHPEEALSDGAQSLDPDEFGKLLKELIPLCNAVGKELKCRI